jgi:hypothetical protein
MEAKEIIIPITEWPKHYQWPTLAGMRNRYYRRKQFGYESAFFKEGKRVLIRVNEFWRVMQERGDK